jgi:uncharacterized protein YjbJ (UPF0337 family)
MDKNRVEGWAKEAKGKVKEGVAEVTGDDELQAEGKLDQAKGKAQNLYGQAKDAVKKY